MRTNVEGTDNVLHAPARSLSGGNRIFSLVACLGAVILLAAVMKEALGDVIDGLRDMGYSLELLN